MNPQSAMREAVFVRRPTTARDATRFVKWGEGEPVSGVIWMESADHKALGEPERITVTITAGERLDEETSE